MGYYAHTPQGLRDWSLITGKGGGGGAPGGGGGGLQNGRGGASFYAVTLPSVKFEPY